MGKESVVLISGCSSGIGLALAREFASRGCRVFATARKPAAIAQLKREKMENTVLDVTDPGKNSRNYSYRQGIDPSAVLEKTAGGPAGPLDDQIFRIE